ncbi:hypothetical protein [Rhodopila sp.]|uniref:hypothetical protein n=1 Tax=Rhodopila sp. TaxID=2480087 RepID=UPI003D0AF2ED
MALVIVAVDHNRAVVPEPQAEFQNALVNGAELLDREVAVVDVFRLAFGLYMGKREHDPCDDVIGQFDAFQNRRGVGLEQAAVVGRDAEAVVAMSDRGEDATQPRPVDRHAWR